MTARALRPRQTASLAVAPVTVTDLTCAQVLGLEPRPYRELLARERVPHAKIGRRVVARIEDVLEALDRLRIAQADASAHAGVRDEEEHEADEPSSVADVLARLGRGRRVA